MLHACVARLPLDIVVNKHQLLSNKSFKLSTHAFTFEGETGLGKVSFIFLYVQWE